jgi:hypothetical protein
VLSTHAASISSTREVAAVLALSAALATAHGRLVPGDLEANATWCHPHRYGANFVVVSPEHPGYIGFTDAKVVLATLGKPRGPTTSVPTRYWS